jgi:hypothetical protein
MKPTHCAITGKSLEAGDPIVNVPGTQHFYGVKARALPLLTAEKRAEIEATYLKPNASARVTAKKEE